MQDSASRVTRAFATIDEGQVHYRTAGRPGSSPPVFALHPSPASSTAMSGLVAALGPHRLVIAPDTLGNGESPRPATDAPDVAYYADTMDRMAAALGHERVDVYGSHTGAHIAIEWAIANPGRVRRIVLDGIAYLSEEERAEYLANYAPHQQPDAIGGQFNWAWHFMRDQMIFFPHFKKDPAHIRTAGNLDTRVLHTLTMEVLKSLETYHMAYEAVFKHEPEKRLGLIEQPVLCVYPKDDYLGPGTALAREKLRDGQFIEIADHHDNAMIAAAVIAFLDTENRA